jgi:divalent metal cation (Fe/Co/Zn/Cd) transporter
VAGRLPCQEQHVRALSQDARQLGVELRSWRVLQRHICLEHTEVLGQRVFIELHMVVDAVDLATAHRITELVEEHLEARFGSVRCTIHLEPREYAIADITFRGTHG